MTFFLFHGIGQFILGGNLLSLFLIPNLAKLATYTQFGKLDD
jgi:hypothetical protein